MNRSIRKSIGALVTGFIFVVIISIMTDFILEKTGLMKQPFDKNPAWFIILVVLYRSLYGAAGAYITARLAPGRPMQHAMIGGMIGLVLSIVGAIVMWDKPPHWYAVSLILTALPAAWLGGRIFMSKNISG